MDVGIGEGFGVISKDTRQARRVRGHWEEFEELGGVAGPVVGAGEKCAEGTEDGIGLLEGGIGRFRRAEGIGEGEVGEGGDGPGEGVGVAGVEFGEWGGVGESVRQGIAEGAKDGGQGGGKGGEEIFFGAAGGGGEAGRVMVRARAARSGGGAQQSGALRRMGRRIQSWRGSGWPGSRRRAPAPEESRQRAEAMEGERDSTWSKARIQLWRAKASSSRGLRGRGEKAQAVGSIRVRRVAAAKDLPEPEGPRRMRMGKGP